MIFLSHKHFLMPGILRGSLPSFRANRLTDSAFFRPSMLANSVASYRSSDAYCLDSRSFSWHGAHKRPGLYSLSTLPHRVHLRIISFGDFHGLQPHVAMSLTILFHNATESKASKLELFKNPAAGGDAMVTGELCPRAFKTNQGPARTKVGFVRSVQLLNHQRDQLTLGDWRTRPARRWAATATVPPKSAHHVSDRRRLDAISGDQLL